MKFCFFDVETTGKIIDWGITDPGEVDNFPRCIQVAWVVSDELGNVLKTECHLIYPQGWTIPKEPFWIEHGFSTERSIIEGKQMPLVLDYFFNDYNDCDILAAHNLKFDYPVLGSEMIRYNKRGKPNPARQKICTMVAGTDVCKIPFGKDHRPWKNKEWKFPKLSELYKKLFDKEMESAHNALADVTATKECFFKLVNLGVINIQKTMTEQ